VFLFPQLWRIRTFEDLPAAQVLNAEGLNADGLNAEGNKPP
jgi:hypothetical protein